MREQIREEEGKGKGEKTKTEIGSGEKSRYITERKRSVVALHTCC